MEYVHYMAPIAQDGASYLMAGMRKTPADPFQYLRMPLDDDMQVDRFMRLYAALRDPSLYDEVAARATRKAQQGGVIDDKLAKQFGDSVKGVLERFASAASPRWSSSWTSGCQPTSARRWRRPISRSCRRGGGRDGGGRRQAGAKRWPPTPPLPLPAGRPGGRQRAAGLRFAGVPATGGLRPGAVVRPAADPLAGKTLVYLGSVLLVLASC
ncbi:Uncharacterised protein [Chromobacterium violaceum]|uniref:ResB-like domain-containing protein n=1 Tax=Chromobacterium violaceum TaxID=536 RepID=A0A447TLM7_CHRVL|nr:Uncharacterised protein [Chromobacterium violaceum]